MRTFIPLALLTLGAASCGGEKNELFTSPGGSGDASVTGDGSSGPPTLAPSDGGDACSGLACQQATCTDGGTTSLSGVIRDPAGKLPLYNVIVYVPNGPLHPLTTGASCDTCQGAVSGSPITSVLTDASGHFVLTKVPVGANIPLVIQVGKWRRELVVPNVAACTNTELTDANQLRLPRKQSEGSLPQMALTTGGADPLECLLRKIGVDDSEFTTAAGSGRVHLYAGGGYTPQGQPARNGASTFDAALNGGKSFDAADTLWGSVEALKKYDVVLMACEGQRNEAAKPTAARQALYDFVSQGGRVFASHWHDYWFTNGPAPLPTIATWTDLTPPPPDPVDATIDTSFPKGAALGEWLSNVGALNAGKLPIKEAKHNVDAVGAGAQSWINVANDNATPKGKTAVQYMTFNTPLGVDATKQCGRVVYSDLHVSSGDPTGQPFPTGCLSSELSPQEKALAFMLYDLSSCIQRDSDRPEPPK